MIFYGIINPGQEGLIMKALSFSRLTHVLGLSLGLMVLWAATAPKTIGANSITGSWGPIEGCPLCIGTYKHSPETDCENAEYGGENMNCIGDTATICLDTESGSKHCSPDSNIPCSGIGGESHPLCWFTHDAKCE